MRRGIFEIVDDLHFWAEEYLKFYNTKDTSLKKLDQYCSELSSAIHKERHKESRNDT